MNKDDLKARDKQEIYDAIAYFIERQKLVAQAMIDMGLDLEEVGEYGSLVWSSNENVADAQLLEDDALEDEQLRKIFAIAKRARARRLPQKGIWKDKNNDEWKYFLHGGGCLLTNVHTGERINWNCPNVLAFDLWFFLDHLEWQLKSPDRKDKFQNTRYWIQTLAGTLISEMIEEGRINKNLTLNESGAIVE